MSTISEQPFEGHGPRLSSFTISEQASEEDGLRFESLGPHFFSRISKGERDGSGPSDAPDTALYDIYHIELSAIGLGMMKSIVFVVLKVCADLGATGFLDDENLEEDQQIKVGSATVSMIEMRFHDSEDVYRSCKIEDLNVETGNNLTKMEAFAKMLRRIQSFCVQYHAEHLAVAPIQGSCWFSRLLKPAGFHICDCERLDEYVGVGFQLCMVLPTPPTELPSRINREPPRRNMINRNGSIALAENRANAAAAGKQGADSVLTVTLRSNTVQQGKNFEVGSSSSESADKPINKSAKELAKEPANKAGRRPEQKPRAVAEGSALGTSSLPQHQEICTSSAAQQQAMGPEGSLARDLTDSVTKEATASRNFPKTAQPATKVANTPGPLPTKAYCMYWLRKGECDYMQSGCKYKHEMPVDEETRQRIGIREIPRWFKESPGYEQYLQQVDREATGTLTGVGTDEKEAFTAQSSRHGSGRRGSVSRSQGGRRTPTTRRDPVEIDSHTVQSPHESHHQRIIASKTEAKTARTGPSSVTKVNSTKDINASATRESSEVKKNNVEDPPRSQAKSSGRSRVPAGSPHSNLFREALSSSRPVADSTKRRPSSPGSDANDQRARPELKRAKTGKNNGQASA